VKKTVFLFYCLVLISICCSSCQADANSSAPSTSGIHSGIPQQLEKVDASLAGHSLRIMLARTMDEKSQGLMFYDSLPENEGMLFVYPSPRLMSFWMYNTKIELDLVFLSDQLTITEFVRSMQPGYGLPATQLPRYVSTIPAQYALELKAGQIDQLGLKIGDQLDIPITMLYSE
jgi:uncharacterized membrane protein (UPF0127 family)